MVPGASDEMAMVEATRWFLALFFLGVAGFYAVRIIYLKRGKSVSPVFTGTPGTVHFATHLAFRVFRVAILGVCVLRLVWPSFDRFLGPIDVLWHPIILMIGNALLAVGFLAVVALHYFMGVNWRSGSRADEETALVTTGPFARSRNPMMLCVMAAQAGLFLALPSVFTLVCLVVGIWAVVAQVGVEERLLRRRFGAQYDAYAATTPRWL